MYYFIFQQVLIPLLFFLYIYKIDTYAPPPTHTQTHPRIICNLEHDL